MAKKKKGNPATLDEFRSLGGKARAKALSKARRSEIARDAADARWRKVRAAAKRKAGRI